MLPAYAACGISIHALLAESDSTFQKHFGFRAISIHALLAESDRIHTPKVVYTRISIHALLAESDMAGDSYAARTDISIHALLAESDFRRRGGLGGFIRFLSTLSLRRATGKAASVYIIISISIHALLAESDQMAGYSPST